MKNSVILSEQEQKNERYLAIGIACILLVLGIYHSVSFYGYEQVPNPDFAHFVEVGHKLWSFELPTDYKRAPLLGLLQVPIGWLFGGQYPDLTGGWLLNSFLYPLNIILLWLVCRKLIGRAGLWVALVAMINPQVVRLLTEPIAETTLMFFCLLSFYLMFKRSRWSYLSAALTTMVRYEGAALILAAFVLDMVECENAKKRFRFLIYAVLASLPLALWMIGMMSHWNQLGEFHYLNNLQLDFLKGIPQRLQQLLNVTFYPMIGYRSGFPRIIYTLTVKFIKILAVVTFLVNLIHAVWKRKWNMIALFIFFLPYMFVHMIYSFSVVRFYIIIHWMLLIFCFNGLYLLWTWFRRTVQIPDVVLGIMQFVLGLIALIWFIFLITNLSELKTYNSTLYYFLQSVIIALTLLLLWEFYFEKLHFWRSRMLTAIILLLIVTSNQYRLGPVLGYGNKSIEFKYVTEWFLQNGESGSRMIATLADVMETFAKGQNSRLAHITEIQADTPEAFVKICREKNVRYIAWDSRTGLKPKDFYYKKWRLKNIAMLDQARDIGPYKFVKAFQNPQEKNRYIYLFYLK